MVEDNHPAGQQTSRVRQTPAQLDGVFGTLTPRQRETFALIAAGLSNEEVARALGVSMNTLKSYIRVTYRKIGVRSRVQAMLMWQQANGETTAEVTAALLAQAQETLATAVALEHQQDLAARTPRNPRRHPTAAPPLPEALEHHLRRDLKACQAVVRELSASEHGRLHALQECAQHHRDEREQPRAGRDGLHPARPSARSHNAGTQQLVGCVGVRDRYTEQRHVIRSSTSSRAVHHARGSIDLGGRVIGPG